MRTDPETRPCQNCRNSFEIEAQDFAFYEKMKVAPPEVCPQCGLQKLMAMRNERVLYKRTCDKCKRAMLSMYSADSEYSVYCHDCWWADDWDGTDYAAEYDPNRPLFDQIKELQRKVPREGLIILNSPNCDYCNHIRDSRNCYLCALISDKTENMLYSNYIVNCQDSSDCLKSTNCQRSYGCIDAYNCYNCIFLSDASDCTDCVFSYDLQGCTNCAFSIGLRNKSYYFENSPLSKEDYEKKIKEVLDGSYSTLKKSLGTLAEIKNKFVRKYADEIQTSDSTGNYLQYCNRAIWCFDGFRNEDVRYAANILFAKNVFYGYAVGTQPVEWSYNVCVIKGGSNIVNSYNLFNSTDCNYCDSLISGDHCIGSIGLKHKNYCVLNKQYSPEEYEKVRAELEKKGELAGKLNINFSTFAFNESAAAYNYPLKKEEGIARGYRWRDNLPMTTGMETLKTQGMPDNINDVSDEFLNEVLACEDCGRNYKIIGQELGLYRQLKVPIPRKCPFCRMEARYAERNPKLLWHRKCDCAGREGKGFRNSAAHFHGDQPCPNQFETSYAPERPEIVYCADCYKTELI